MGLFTRLFGRSVNTFAKQLALDLKRRYPPDAERGEGKRISAKGISNILEEVFQKAIEFKKQGGAGLFVTARLINAFKWELAELGYSKQFIEVVTEGLVVYLTKGKSPEVQ